MGGAFDCYNILFVCDFTNVLLLWLQTPQLETSHSGSETN